MVSPSLRWMETREIQVTFDCAGPAALAAFWSAALGYERQAPPPGFDTWEAALSAFGVPESEWNSRSAAVPLEGSGPRLFFQRVPEGKVVKNRVHLDVRVGTGMVGEERLAALEAECARLIPLGATRFQLLLADDENESCLVMQDVEGNEFCLD